MQNDLSPPSIPNAVALIVEGNAYPSLQIKQKKKIERYAEEFKTHLQAHNSDCTLFVSKVLGLVIKCNGNEVFRCDATHQNIKSAYFLFRLSNSNITVFLRSANTTDFELTGELSPEDFDISHP